MTQDLTLSGLDGSNPLGFLAALGVLLAARDQRPQGADETRLYWRNEGLWRPVLTGFGAFEDLLPVLAEDIASWRGDPALDLHYEKGSGKQAHDLKPLPFRFRGYLEGLLSSVDPRRSRALEYAAAFGTEIAVDKAHGNVKPTALHFTAGQQEFLAMVEQLIEGVTQGDLLEAVQGPWRYERPLPVLQWDATSARLYALRASDPSSEKKLGVPGADWLAFRGLSFLRVAPVAERIVTTGCGGRWKTGHFTWPLWIEPLGTDAIRSVLGWPAVEHSPPKMRRALGLGVVFRSQIQRSDQGGYGSFSPPQVV